MRIAIDARELSKGQPGGFHSYLSGLLAGLSEVDSINEYILLIDRPLPEEHLRLPSNTELRMVRWNRLIADRLPVQYTIRRSHPDVVHYPCNYGLDVPGIPSVITLHDCIGLEQSGTKGPLKHRILTAYSARMIRKSVPVADRIITISNYSKSRILEWFDIEDRIRMIYQGVTEWPDAGIPPSERMERLPLNRPYILASAAPDPRKNVATVIAAFSVTQACRDGCRLVIIANHPSAVVMSLAQLNTAGIRNRATIMTKVTDSELQSLYKHAMAYTFASLEEGFGLTPLEAMSCGCPVISSNASVMPEVLGDSVLYFDPLELNDLAAGIDLVWRDDQVRESLRAKGYERVKLYSWARTAAATLDVYRDLAELR